MAYFGTKDPQIEIAAGAISNYLRVNIAGRNADVDIGTVPEDIWDGGGTYTGFPTGSAETITVVSTSANDTSAGTGARTIRIVGLDASGNVQTEDLTMNGLSNVTSVNTFRRVHRCYVLTAGSGGTNAGVITGNHTTTTANVFFVMAASTSESEVAAYTIPTGYTGFLVRYRAEPQGATAVTVECALWVRESSGAARLLRPFTVATGSPSDFELYGGLSLPALTDITLRTTSSSANNVNITGSFDIVLRTN